jgi:tRNA pseudouridine55 synthase
LLSAVRARSTRTEPRERRVDRSGVLVVDKGRGATSFDVVAIVRRRLGVRRIGHAGTLDPDATGVLPILVGEATKITLYLVDQDKEYLATVRFGLTTDTHDVSGRVLSETPVDDLVPARLEDVCRAFVGHISRCRRCTRRSTIRAGGSRACARGIEVERAPRDHYPVDRDREDRRTAGDAPCRLRQGNVRARARRGPRRRLWLRRRRRVFGALPGRPFDLRDAVSWPDLMEGGHELWSRVRPVEAALAGWPVVRLDGPGAATFGHGQPADVIPAAAGTEGFVRVHDITGPMIGVGELMAGGSKVRPVRILHADRPRTRILPA